MRSSFRLAAVVAVLLATVPLAASADGCPTVRGNAIYDYLDGTGTANLNYDGEQIFVEFEGVSFDNSDLPNITRVTRWHFPDGSVDFVETYEISANGASFTFDSTVTVDSGGSGSLTWSVESIGRIGLVGRNAIHQIEGNLCVGD